MGQQRLSLSPVVPQRRPSVDVADLLELVDAGTSDEQGTHHQRMPDRRAQRGGPDWLRWRYARLKTSNSLLGITSANDISRKPKPVPATLSDYFFAAGEPGGLGYDFGREVGRQVVVDRHRALGVEQVRGRRRATCPPG